MVDIALNWNDDGADIVIENGDILSDNGLATAVMISLFSDARAPESEVLPDGETSRRGWWGDYIGTTTGSLLWLSEREKTLPSTAAKKKRYCEDALKWLLDKNIAQKVEVTATIIKPQAVQIKINIYRGTSKDYSYLWEAMENYDSVSISNENISVEFIEKA